MGKELNYCDELFLCGLCPSASPGGESAEAGGLCVEMAL
jgi:hypothetical protein